MIQSSRRSALTLSVVTLFASTCRDSRAALSECEVNDGPLTSTLHRGRGLFDAISENSPHGDHQHHLFDTHDGVLSHWKENLSLPEATLVFKPRMYYRHRDLGRGKKLEALAYGGTLEFNSGWIKDRLKLKLVGALSNDLYSPDDGGGTGLLGGGDRGYGVLAQASLEVKLRDQTTARLYRQVLNMPFINARDSRMTPNSFEGYTLRSVELEGWKFFGGHLTKLKGRESSDFVSFSEGAGAVNGPDRGLTYFGFNADLGETGNVGLVNQYGWDVFNTVYLEGNQKWELDAIAERLTFGMGAQFMHQHSVGDALAGNFDAYAFGLRATAAYEGLTATAAWTSTASGDATRNPYGIHPSFNALMMGNFNRAGENAFRLGLSYDFAEMGLEGFSAFTNFVYGDTPDSGSSASPDRREWDITVDYRRPEEPLKNLWLRTRFGRSWTDNAPQQTEFRVVLNYSLNF